MMAAATNNISERLPMLCSEITGLLLTRVVGFEARGPDLFRFAETSNATDSRQCNGPALRLVCRPSQSIRLFRAKAATPALPAGHAGNRASTPVRPILDRLIEPPAR